MTHKTLTKQMLEASRAAFESSFRAMVMLQEQAEQMTNQFLNQATWLPEEGRKLVEDWVDACKKGREEYKRRADEGFQKVSDYLESAGEEAFRQIEERAD